MPLALVVDVTVASQEIETVRVVSDTFGRFCGHYIKL